MSKSRKSLTILSCAIVPVLYGAQAALAQDVVAPIQYADGNPPTLPGFWPTSVQNANQGPSATGTDPVITANPGNANLNGAPGNGGPGVVSSGTVNNPAGSALVNESISTGGKTALFGQTFMPTTSFKLGGVSFDMVNGGDAGFMANAASIHLYQFNPGTVTGTSTSYNLSTQSTGTDLLGGGAGAVWTPAAIANIGQFVFSGADQVTLQANTEYVFEIFVDTVDSGDSVGLMRTSGSDNMPGPQPYTNGALFGLSPTQSGVSQSTYSANFTLSRSSDIYAGAGLFREAPFAVYSAAPAVTAGTWTGGATNNSDWNSSGNWSAGAIPGGTPGDSALFGTGAASVNVNLNGTQTLGRLTFNGPAYTIAQGSGGTLTIEGTSVSATAHIDDLFGNSTITAPVAVVSPTQITVGQATNTLTFAGNITGSGSVTLTGDTTIAVQAGVVLFTGSNSYGGGTTVNGGKLIIGAAGALPNGAVTISAGTLQLGSSIGLTQMTSLAISGNGTLDINNDHVLIHYGSGPDPISSIAAMISSGYAGGAWNGTGIVSSAAAATSSQYGIGYADSADPGNPAGLASGTIEIAYTLLGDADLNHIVNGIDFGIVAANFNQGVTSWDQGDFDYSHIVNGIDFGDLAANFNQGANNAAAWAAVVQFAEANGLMADVPEPASIGLLALGAGGLMARRHKRRDGK